MVAKKLTKTESVTPKSSPQSTSNKIIASIILLAWVFICLIASQIVIGAVMLSILGDNLYRPLWTTIYTAISYIVSGILIIFVPIKLSKQKSWKRFFAKFTVVSGPKVESSSTEASVLREQLGLTGWLKWRDIGLAIVGFFVYFIFAALLVWIFTSIFPWFDADAAQNVGYANLGSLSDRLLALFALVIAAPIAEEIIFRGWLYAKLRSRLGIWVATLLVSVLFGLAHGSWNVGVNVFAMSAVMCLMREVTGTIYGGIILHVIKNAVAFYLLIYTNVL